jgi:hypothetical protein
MPGQIGTSIRANTRKIHSGDREADAIDAAGLAQARERFALPQATAAAKSVEAAASSSGIGGFFGAIGSIAAGIKNLF